MTATQYIPLYEVTIDGYVTSGHRRLTEALADVRGCGNASVWLGDCRLLRRAGNESTQDNPRVIEAVRTLSAWNPEVRTLLMDRGSVATRAATYRGIRRAIKACRLVNLGATDRAHGLPMAVIRKSPAYAAATR